MLGLAITLTDTSLTPEQPFDLQEGDHVNIIIGDIGALSNSVTIVRAPSPPTLSRGSRAATGRETT